LDIILRPDCPAAMFDQDGSVNSFWPEGNSFFITLSLHNPVMLLAKVKMSSLLLLQHHCSYIFGVCVGVLAYETIQSKPWSV